MTQTPVSESPPSTTTDPSGEQQLVRDAAALGWALTELLSRCFLLEQLQPEDKAALKQAWVGESMRILPPTRSPRQLIHSVLFRIRSLATELNVDKLKIEPVVLDRLQIAPDALAKLKRDPNEPDKVCYLDALEENVTKLCGDDFDPEKGTFTYFRGQINGLLLYWDTLIYDNLQAMSTDPAYSYFNAYLVGRGFATIPWDLAPGDPVQDRAKIQHELVNRVSLHRLCDYVQLMTPSLPKFAATALVYSVTLWGNAFLQHQVNGESSLQLQDQAEIWHNLLTGRRDPTTYIAPSTTVLRYTLKVILFALPSILLGLALALGIILVISFLLYTFGPFIDKAFHISQLVTTIVGAIAGGIALIAAGLHLRTVWVWITQIVPNLDPASVTTSTSAAISSAQPSLVAMLWDEAQQEVINKATYIPVPSVVQRLRIALAHSLGPSGTLQQFVRGVSSSLASRFRRP